MNLTKRQVKALLEVISADESRPVLTHAKIDTFNDQTVLVATDSYKLAAINLDPKIVKPILGQLIPRAELQKWYKLATNKDFLTDTDLLTITVKESEVGKYPQWQQLVPDKKKFSALAGIGLNASYLLTIQTLIDTTALMLEFYGPLMPVVIRHDQNTYIVMPIKG